MRLTKDEARILAWFVLEIKDELSRESRNIAPLYDALEDLERRLADAGKDQRRTGRTSLDGFDDCLKRFASDYDFRLRKKCVESLTKKK